MKRLCLVRHAKSNWVYPSQEDKERPIDERGEHDAKLMADMLLDHKIKPDLILSSVAKRAIQTAELMADEMNFSKDIIIENQEIYDAGVEDLLTIIQQQDNQYNTILVVGHNPGLTMLANYLAEDHIPSLPTCGTYCIDFKTDNWEDITTVEGKTLFVDFPKNHPEL